MSIAARIGVGLAVVAAILVGIGIWWFAGSAEDEVDQSAAEQLASELANDDAPDDPDVATPVNEPAPVDDVNGTWTVTGQDPEAVSDGSFAGYRIDEILSGLENTVTGRTSRVTGTITIEGDQLTGGTFEVDMVSIASDQSQRDNQMRNRGYEFAVFPTSTFEVTEPVAIDAAAALAGEVQQATVTGTLTLHGITQEVTLDLSASIISETTLVVTGSIDIALADFDIEKPVGLRVADIDDVGVMEFQLFFAKG